MTSPDTLKVQKEVRGKIAIRAQEIIPNLSQKDSLVAELTDAVTLATVDPSREPTVVHERPAGEPTLLPVENTVFNLLGTQRTRVSSPGPVVRPTDFPAVLLRESLVGDSVRLEVMPTPPLTPTPLRTRAVPAA